MYRAAHGRNHGFGFKYVKLVFTDTEADRTNASAVFDQRFGNENSLVDIIHADGVFSRFGHDDFIGFAVDHQLPAAFMNVVTFGVFPDGETPFFEKMYGRIDVPGDIGHEVLAGNPHQIVSYVIDIIFDRIFAAVYVNVLVNRR